MLYDPARHEPLRAAAWDASRARDAIDRIVRDAEARFSAQSHWPIHPKDADGGDAGPLAKGANLCHGTSGNGYAFLALYRRTGAAPWLERARAFAMHAIAQWESDAARYGQMRYSLWTGDPGLAIYLWDCIRGRGAFPTLDVFCAGATRPD